jgi:hypothetical protein
VFGTRRYMARSRTEASGIQGSNERFGFFARSSQEIAGQIKQLCWLKMIESVLMVC